MYAKRSKAYAAWATSAPDRAPRPGLARRVCRTRRDRSRRERRSCRLGRRRRLASDGPTSWRRNAMQMPLGEPCVRRRPVAQRRSTRADWPCAANISGPFRNLLTRCHSHKNPSISRFAGISRCRRRDSNPRHADYDWRVAAHFGQCFKEARAGGSGHFCRVGNTVRHTMLEARTTSQPPGSAESAVALGPLRGARGVSMRVCGAPLSPSLMSWPLRSSARRAVARCPPRRSHATR